MKQHRHVEETRVARRNGIVARRWLLLLALGIAFVWQLRLRRDSARPATGQAGSGGRETAPPEPLAGHPSPAEPARVEPTTTERVEPTTTERVEPPSTELTSAEPADSADCGVSELSRAEAGEPAADEPDPGETVAAAEPAVLTRAEAAHILGCSADEASQLLNGSPVTRGLVEQLALEHYRWRKHVDDTESYWVTLKQASLILGVSTQRLKRLLDSGDVPCVVHRDGVRLMRREELGKAARAAQDRM